MPYIIKTTTDREDDARRLERAGHGCEAYQLRHAPPSRRAVATLDEAPEIPAAVAEHAERDGRAMVGPLADGTVIEVERVNVGALAARAKLDPIFVFGEGRMGNAEIIDAYNEAQS